jgi:hypothetical protein
MLHFASLGGVLHLIIQMAGGVLSSISHQIHMMSISDTPIVTK